MARGFSNERITFKGITKSGVNELMAVHHRIPNVKYKMTTGMLGLVSDAVVRSQKKHENYRAGVRNLFNTAFKAFN